MRSSVRVMIVTASIGMLCGCFFDDQPVAPRPPTSHKTTTSVVDSVRTRVFVDSTAKSTVHHADTAVTDSLIDSAGIPSLRVTTGTITDTVVRAAAVVESTIVDSFVTSTTIVDAYFPDSKVTRSDTTVLHDTIEWAHGRVIGDSVHYDTAAPTVTTIADTQFVADYVVAATSDYREGNLGALSLDSMRAFPNLLAVFSDNAIRAYHGNVYILERLGRDNLVRIAGSLIAHGAPIAPTAVDYWKNIGAGINIQDIAFASDGKAYVTALGSSHVRAIDPATGTQLGLIDMSEFGAYSHTPDSIADSLPYMTQAEVHGANLYVACQRLRNFEPADTSCIAVISVLSDHVVGKINLLRKNPCTFAFCGGKIYVACTGSNSSQTDGGVECIDAATGMHLGLLLGEAQFGGDVAALVMISEHRAYVGVSKHNADWTSFWTDVVTCDPGAGIVGARVNGIDNAFGGMCYDGLYLYVADRSATNPGIVVIDPKTNAKIGVTHNVGIPPNAITALRLR